MRRTRRNGAYSDCELFRPEINPKNASPRGLHDFKRRQVRPRRDTITQPFKGPSEDLEEPGLPAKASLSAPSPASLAPTKSGLLPQNFDGRFDQL